MRVLAYQCPAGISGDMNLGAMIDLGVDPDELIGELQKLGLEGWTIKTSRDLRGGISGTRCDVVIEDEHHHHHHSHDHGHHHHGHDHAHGRTYAEIRTLIEQSPLHEQVKADAQAVFHALAVAEGKVHAKSVEEVHFHEVGAVDSIVDIVGAALCWHLLGVDSITCGVLELGGGTVDCAHGRMPVPAPATANLLAGLPVTQGASDKESTTPTGAALLVGKGASFNQPLQGRVLKSGIGIGQRDDPKLANVLYATLLETESAGQTERDSVTELVTNLDDMRPEAVAYLMEQLLAAGALDAWQTPATFKKGRLGVTVHALGQTDCVPALEAVFFQHSDTLGLRRQTWERSKLRREVRTVNMPLGSVRIKEAYLGEQRVRQKPEYDDLQALAAEHGLSLAVVEQRVKDFLHLEGSHDA
ncbi:MAG: nickel pincer cofactor biosynthesis protein LarC [Verrucomicrobiota bacterium]